MTGGLVPRMRRLRGVAGSFTYCLVCDQLASLFLSHCFALLRSCSCGLPSFKTAAVSSLSMLPLALPLALPSMLPSTFDDNLF